MFNCHRIEILKRETSSLSHPVIQPGENSSWTHGQSWKYVVQSLSPMLCCICGKDDLMFKPATSALQWTVAHLCIFYVYIYYVDAEFNLMSLDCSSPQWKWRGDPWQQTIYWVFWSGWWSWRGVLVVWKWWNKGKNKWVRKSEVAGLLHAMC